MKYCCKEFEQFDKFYGHIEFIVATPQSLEGMDDYKGRYRYFRDLWNFKFCPFCGKKLK